jgi:MFS family permease
MSWALLSTSQLATGGIMWTAAVTSVFHKRRGLALALMLMGSGTAVAILPRIVLQLYKMFGIRGAFTSLACLVLIVSLPIQIYYSLPRHRERFALDRRVATSVRARGVFLLRAMCGFKFWQLAIGFSMGGGLVGAIIVHFQALMTDKGLSMERAAWVMSLFGATSLGGRVVTGMLLDRWTARRVILLMFSFPILACFILANFHGELGWAIVVAIFAGLGFGAESDMMAYFAGRYFGAANYATIYAALMGLFALGFAGVPVLAGFLFDAIGSYNLSFGVLGLMLLASVMLMMLLGDYPDAPVAVVD